MATWSVDGHWVMFSALTKTVVVRRGSIEGDIVVDAPVSSSAFEFTIHGAKYRFTKTSEFTSNIKLERIGAGFIPESVGYHPRIDPSPGSCCATHEQAPAIRTCSRCGTFVCAECVGPDLVHCRGCFERLEQAAQRLPRVWVYTAPGFIFAVSGGLLGAMIGVLTGSLAYAAARQTDRRWLRVAMAAGLYLLGALTAGFASEVVRAAMHTR
jgi:hypothetical protein